MAKKLEKIIDLNVDPSAFRLHSKGKGLICVNPKGITKNKLINKYAGEVYSPARWYEKQDAIKKYMKDHHQKNDLLDFYNIVLETHKIDPDGYKMLVTLLIRSLIRFLKETSLAGSAIPVHLTVEQWSLWPIMNMLLECTVCETFNMA